MNALETYHNHQNKDDQIMIVTRHVNLHGRDFVLVRVPRWEREAPLNEYYAAGCYGTIPTEDLDVVDGTLTLRHAIACANMCCATSPEEAIVERSVRIVGETVRKSMIDIGYNPEDDHDLGIILRECYEAEEEERNCMWINVAGQVRHGNVRPDNRRWPL